MKLFTNAYKVKTFIENYPGTSKEEKTFMENLLKKYNYRYQIVQKNTFMIGCLVCIPILLGSVKWRLSKYQSVLLLIGTPLTIYFMSHLCPLFDFALSTDLYIRDIMKSDLPLSEIFKE
ncbi:hypothetical protein SteCoe_30503 [Stentor coeruleus]|uniref:Uncharacterized protein n=1 Tax=Stentor coeruleus TaxID=5963 RepID=A0A1R2B3S7_9CILI|nr:hypothetical protein SteCoe_30503 [Stentor coeruleus]